MPSCKMVLLLFLTSSINPLVISRIFFFVFLDDVKKYGNLPIPLKIRNAPTKFMKEIGYGKGYEKYPKDDLLPEKLKGKKYFKE